MKNRSIHFNIHDLNFILTFSGFAIFTSFASGISSVIYRAIALGVALICILSTRLKFQKIPSSLKLLVLLVCLMDIKSAFHLLIEPSPYLESRNLSLLFIFGVTLIPVLAFVVGYKNIHWKTTLIVLEVLLSIIIVKAILTSSGIAEEGRVALNERQSTLAFGDNSSYLLVLSLCLMFQLKTIRSRIWRIICAFLLVSAMVASILGLARAGSRGPVIAGLMGSAFIFVSLSSRKQIILSIIAILVVIISGLSLSSLQKFAPVLYQRMANTINEGDMSGRDILFEKAVHQIETRPIIGSNPVSLFPDGFSSCHNGYLEVGVSLGVLGFLIYVVLNLWLIFNLFLSRKRILDLHHLFLSAMFFLAATRAMTGASLLDTPNYTLSMVGACLVASVYTFQKASIECDDSQSYINTLS